MKEIKKGDWIYVECKDEGGVQKEIRYNKLCR